MNIATQERFGVDVGHVIIDGIANNRTDTSFFGPRYLETTAVPGAFETIATLVAERFHEEAYIVSKCGEKTQRKTVQWFDHHRFYEITGIERGHTEFCLERPDKAPICKRLGITHFVDDKLEVLMHLIGIVPYLFLFQGRKNEIARFAHALPHVIRVESWQEVGQLLLPPSPRIA